MRSHGDGFWTLDGSVDFLNHGSFGATPRPVQDAQAEWRRRLESQPVRFFQREMEGELDKARAVLSDFLGVRHHDLAFVPNATAGVNAVLRSYDLAQGDQILITDHVYNACRNVADYVAARSHAEIVVAEVPFPLRTPSDAADAILGAATARTRLAIVEHVTSPTALILPIRRHRRRTPTARGRRARRPRARPGDDFRRHRRHRRIVLRRKLP